MIAGLANYWVSLVLLAVGMVMIIDSANMIRKMVGLGVFQSAVFLLFITLGKKAGGDAPILGGSAEVFSNPLPHVLILTAIVVGVATTALGLALIARIRRAYGSISEDDIDDKPEIEPELAP